MLTCLCTRIQSSLGTCGRLDPGPPGISKSADVQVPYIKWHSTAGLPLSADTELTDIESQPYMSSRSVQFSLKHLFLVDFRNRRFM